MENFHDFSRQIWDCLSFPIIGQKGQFRPKLPFLAYTGKNKTYIRNLLQTVFGTSQSLICLKKSWELSKSCLNYFSTSEANFFKCPFWDNMLIWPFWWFLMFLWAWMANLSQINLNVNDGQNKFEVDISKNVAKIANFWPKIGQLPFRRATF